VVRWGDPVHSFVWVGMFGLILSWFDLLFMVSRIFFLLCVFFRCPPFHAATNREKQQRILHVSPLFVAKTLPEYNAFQFEFGGVWNYLVTRILINSHFSSFI